MDLFEIVLILAIALIVLGPERLPEVLRTAGKVLRELRSASNTVVRELTEALEDDPSRPAVTRPASVPDSPRVSGAAVGRGTTPLESPEAPADPPKES